MRPTTRRWFARCSLALAAALLVLGTAGCSGNGQGQKLGAKLVNIDTYLAASKAVEAEHKLPPGFLWPKPGPQETGTKYEEGVARQEVETYWACAWETEWLEQRNKDAKREAKAFAVLRNEIPNSRMMKEYSDQSVRQFYADALKKAELGDPSGIQKDVQYNGFVARRTR